VSAEYSLKRRVTFAETDLAGVMHFSNYYRWMEEVEHAFWRSAGSSVVVRGDDSEVSWPRVATSCEYFAPAHFEDELELRFKVDNVGKRSMTYEVEFVRGEQRVALGRTTAVCCSTSPGKFESIPIPADLRNILEGSASAKNS